MTANAVLDAMTLHAGTGEDFIVPAHAHLCLGPPGKKHMSGGVCTGVMAMALETRFARPLIQCSTFFMRAPERGTEAAIRIEPLQEGNTIVLARANLSSGGTQGAVLQASLGDFRGGDDLQWAGPIEAPAPETCERLPFIRQDPDDLHTQLDIRLAHEPGSSRSGRLSWWVRAPEYVASQASAFLALIADYIPEAVHHGLGRPAGAISLDNNLRIIGRELTPWLYCETRLSAIRSGVFHGTMSLRNQDGRVLALASQTGLVRELVK
jgi:acyl-CoA thioesterase II